MFVLVPIKVQVPPKMEAYDSGMSSFEAGWSIFRASVMTTKVEV